MKPYFEDDSVQIFHGDCRDILPHLPKVDLLVTDPPYGLSFMGKDWDKAVPPVEIWRQSLGLLEPGAFAFVMSIPRQDCLARMIVNLQDAGFETGFTSLYWTYASGFPKAQNIGKAVDKRLGVEREIVNSRISAYGTEPVAEDMKSRSDGKGGSGLWQGGQPKEVPLSGEAVSPQAKALDGSYAGYQPKPAVEVIIVAMKPLSEKTYVDQALANGKGVTWLDDGRIPHSGEKLGGGAQIRDTLAGKDGWDRPCKHDPKMITDKLIRVNESVAKGESRGRFPANLLVSDDVLNDGKVRESKGHYPKKRSPSTMYGGGKGLPIETGRSDSYLSDSGSFSRYFDLDKWANTLPFLITPKASKAEKGKDCTHPTVKPLKLMAYLITLGSREGNVILDPFMGTGTTLLAAQKMGRKAIGIEIEERYCEIAAKRMSQTVMRLECPERS